MEEEDREQEGNVEPRMARSTAGAEGGAGTGAAHEDGGERVGQEEEEAEGERDDEVVEEPDEETLAKMSSREQRLFKIRLMMNKVCVLLCVVKGALGCSSCSEACWFTGEVME